MSKTFHTEDVFPVIARILVSNTSGVDRFLSHDEIVAALLADSEGAALVAAAKTSSKLKTVNVVAANMVAWFSQQITTGQSKWGDFFDRKKIARRWAYRPKTAATPSMVEDVEISAVEGEPMLFFHLKRERSPHLRQAKLDEVLATGTTPSCEACGFQTQHLFPGLESEILEAHHRLPLSTFEGAVETKLADLALLCPSCHRATHRTMPILSVEQFRARYFGGS